MAQKSAHEEAVNELVIEVLIGSKMLSDKRTPDRSGELALMLISPAQASVLEKVSEKPPDIELSRPPTQVVAGDNSERVVHGDDGGKTEVAMEQSMPAGGLEGVERSLHIVGMRLNAGVNQSSRSQSYECITWLYGFPGMLV